MAGKLDLLKNYFNLGFSLIPLEGKRPLIKWKPFQKHPSSWELVLSWNEKYPEANWATLTGKVSGLLALDVDENSQALFDAFWNRWPTTWTKTGRGFHILFRIERDYRVEKLSLEGFTLEVKGNSKKMIILPPSRHENGEVYHFLRGLEELAPLPEELKRALITEENQGALISPYLCVQWLWKKEVAEGERHQTLFVIGSSLLQKQGKERVASLLRQRNGTFSPPISESELRALLKSLKKEKGIKCRGVRNLFPEVKNFCISCRTLQKSIQEVFPKKEGEMMLGTEALAKAYFLGYKEWALASVLVMEGLDYREVSLSQLAKLTKMNKRTISKLLWEFYQEGIFGELPPQVKIPSQLALLPEQRA